MSTVSAAGLPTDLGTCQSPPAGLLCSGRQDRNVVVSLVLLQFMVRRKPAGKSWLSRQPPHERLVKRKARGQEQGADWFRRKPIETRSNGQASLCLPKSALFFWTVHGPFSFRQDEKKMGGGIRPSSPGGRNLPLWHFQKEERGMGTFHSLGVLRETTRYFPPHSRRFRASSRAFRSSTP